MGPAAETEMDEVANLQFCRGKIRPLRIYSRPRHAFAYGEIFEAQVTQFSPGTPNLQLLLGDKDHIAHNPPVMSLRICVVVSEVGAAPAAP
jgi:hypothetical protein